MKHKLSRGEKKLIIASLLAFSILGGGYGWRSQINREPDVNIPPYPKLPNPNGYDLYIRAAQTMVTANPAVDEINDGKAPTDPKVRAQQYSLARKEAWLKQNAAGFQIFQTALKTPCLQPSTRGTIVFGQYARFRELARNVKIRSHTQQMSNDWNGAMQSRIDIVQMGNDTARGGPLIAALVGTAIQAIGQVEQWPIIEKMDATQCRAAIKRLESIYAQRLLASDALTEEKYYGQIEMLKMMRESNWRVLEADEFGGFGREEKLTVGTRWRALTVSKRTIMDNYMRYMDTLIHNARLPYKAHKKSLPPLDDPFSQTLAGVFERAPFSFARNDAGNALWMVALALRAYKLENGKYPAQLKELTPKYLKEIPADPFGAGESLRYKNWGSEYSLYSIGPDGIDNGGKPAPHSKDSPLSSRKKIPTIVPESKGDYVAGKNR